MMAVFSTHRLPEVALPSDGQIPHAASVAAEQRFLFQKKSRIQRMVLMILDNAFLDNVRHGSVLKAAQMMEHPFNARRATGGYDLFPRFA